MRYIASLVPPLLLLSACSSSPSTAEMDRLRAENAQLRQQVAAQQATAAPAPAAAPTAPAAPAPTAPPAVATAPAGPGLDLALPAGSTEPGTGSSVASAAPAPVMTAPPGFRLVKDPDKYTQTGCSEGMMATTPEAGWKHRENWGALHKGDSLETVEGLIGVDHYNVTSGKRVIWQYGKCGHFVSAYVVFEKSAALYWSAPDE